MFVRPEFWDAAECRRIRAAMDRAPRSPAEIYADGFRVDEAARRAFDVDVEDALIEEVVRAIDAARPQVAAFFNVTLSGAEGPGFLRYEPGGFYGEHRDVSPEWEQFPRRISVVVFLTTAGEDCEGGSLRVYGPEPLDIAPRAGLFVAFPSETPHEVLPVTAGVRDAIVDWFY